MLYTALGVNLGPLHIKELKSKIEVKNVKLALK